MQNLYEIVKTSLFFNKFVLNDLVCVEYTCPLEEEELAIFTQHDYIVHVLSGQKTWRTIDGVYTLKSNETLYVKKGASLITQHLEEDFCMLAFFLPDEIIKSSLDEMKGQIARTPSDSFIATRLKENSYLIDFFHSMLVYFKNSEQPPDSILKIKIKELIISIVHKCGDISLMSYLNSIKINRLPSLGDIMEANFCYNLSLKDFAKITNRSLSSFKRDFNLQYQTTPGKWLLSRRLEYAANLLLINNENISQIAFESGFQDLSHFSRVFKVQYNVSPSDYRKTQ